LFEPALRGRLAAADHILAKEYGMTREMLIWLLIGLIVGWAVAFVWDWLFWRRRGAEIADHNERLQATADRQHEELIVLNNQVKAETARADALSATVNDQRVQLNAARTRVEESAEALSVVRLDNETLRAELDASQERVESDQQAYVLAHQCQEKLDSAESTIATLQARLQEEALKTGLAQQLVEKLRGQLSQSTEQLRVARVDNSALQDRLAAAVVPTAKDDLKLIKGIGAVFERRLNEAGVHTFQQLAALTVPAIVDIIKPQEWQEFDYESWLSQAKSHASQSRQVE
jgi:predicted flap endonuclease-1-like 5' DNA nuclease